MQTLTNYLTQWSTWRGIVLIGAAVAGVHPDLVNAVVNVGDVVVQGVAASAAASVGAWEAFRNERKQNKTKVWRG
ncbi:hypothetical protein [Shewanella putrefaciens]|uniref:hypothetical protein n=1 Tax=Shewanella putrefaciens TaxID=24 RepID=UPI0018E877D3|nr:hypothetical protein [Shewanella putrefaciens]